MVADGLLIEVGAEQMLDISVRDVGGITVLDLKGSMVAGLGVEALAQRFKQLIAEQRVKVVANMKDVSVIDSRGVGELVASFSSLKKSGGSLKLAGPSKFVREVLQITRIATIIDICDTEEAALKAFAA
jgi:anti-sigma B factor antagonist